MAQCARCGSAFVSRSVRPRPWLRWLVVAGVPLLAGMLLGAPLLQDFFEGQDRSRLPLWRIGAVVAVIAASIVAAVASRHRPVCPRCGTGRLLVADPEPAQPTTTRRTVLRATGTVAAATVTGVAGVIGPNRGWLGVGREIGASVETQAPQPDPAWAGARIQAERRLGRTNVRVSDISLGSSRIRNVDVPRALFERGVTYVDTAPDYADAGSERLLGQALRGHRDRVFLATKFCRPSGHLPDDTPVEAIMAEVEQSLRRLQTDYVDLIHIHSCDRLERLLAPNIHEAFDRLKAQGKVRFLGVSTHTPNLEEVAHTAIDSGRFDVLMLAYHFAMWPDFAHILEKARQHDVGIVAMKTLKGARHVNLAEFAQDRASYAQSAFRWVLSNPDVSALVVSFSTMEHVDEYLAASGTALLPEDMARLERYDRLVAGDYCQPHCGACLPSCPHDLPIHDVLRYRMYAKDYGWPEEGRARYAALATNASTCAACPAPCAGACPHGIPIRATMLNADRVLTA